MTKNAQKLPNGWKVKKVLDAFPLQRGFDLPEQNIVPGDYPIVYSNGIKGNHNVFKVKAPGVVTGRSGTIGKVTFVEKDFWPHNTSLWVTDFKGNDPKFVFYKLQMLNFAKFSSGSGVPTLNRNDVHVEKIILPPLAEQRAIVGTLAVWDEGIESLEKLIALKEKQKKAIMQQLLTGTQRLKNFTGTWKTKKLGEIGKCIRGVSYKPEDLQEKESAGTTFLLRSSNIQNSHLVFEDMQIVPAKIVNKNQILQKNDIVICMANGSKNLVGKSATFKNEEEKFTVGAFCAIFRNEKIYSNLLPYYFETERYRNWINVITAGSSINNLKNEDIENFKIPVPELPEQRAIADVLSACDEELDLLRKKLLLLREQKKGLMQQLLTGTLRIALKSSKTTLK